MLHEGSLLDRYYLQEKIGGGGEGQVYRAKDTHMDIGREVAVKVIKIPDDSENVNLVMSRFLREVQAITRLNHPHIVPVFDYGIDTQTKLAYIVMPLCQLGSLASWCKDHPPSSHAVMHFLHQASDALQHVHDQKIIHKDVKPQNFLLRQNINDPHLPDLMLADFGIAKLHTATFSLGNLPLGTVSYMAPEQWERKPVYASDQYSLAIMAYELLTGKRPFRGSSEEELANQHHNVKPEPPSSLNSDISIAIDKVILRALAKKPEDRYPCITKFFQALLTVYEKENEQKQLSDFEQRIQEKENLLAMLQQKEKEKQQQQQDMERQLDLLEQRCQGEEKRLYDLQQGVQDEQRQLSEILEERQRERDQISKLQSERQKTERELSELLQFEEQYLDTEIEKVKKKDKTIRLFGNIGYFAGIFIVLIPPYFSLVSRVANNIYYDTNGLLIPLTFSFAIFCFVLVTFVFRMVYKTLLGATLLMFMAGTLSQSGYIFIYVASRNIQLAVGMLLGGIIFSIVLSWNIFKPIRLLFGIFLVVLLLISCLAIGYVAQNHIQIYVPLFIEGIVILGSSLLFYYGFIKSFDREDTKLLDQ